MFTVRKFQKKEQSESGPLRKKIKLSDDQYYDVKHVIAEYKSKLTVKPQKHVNLSPISVLRHHDLQKRDEQLKDPSIIDIDFNHKDPLLCSLYASDIYEHNRVAELNHRPSFEYMENIQRYVTSDMRVTLVDWLIEVSECYKLVPETLYLTVNLIDRYLSGNRMEQRQLQLLSVTCMLIASKYEERKARSVQDFCDMTDNSSSEEEVLLMEKHVLKFLCYQLSVPTVMTFLRRYIHAAQATYKDPSIDFEFLANYLAELTLVEYSFLKFPPSLIAASAVFLARWTVDQSAHPWNPTLEHYTGYNTAELKVTVTAMQDLQLNNSESTLNTIRKKYRHKKFNGVASMSSPEAVQRLFL